MGRARLQPCRPEPFKLRGSAPRHRAEAKRASLDFLCAGFIPGSRWLFFSPQRSCRVFPSSNPDMRKLTGLKVGQPPAAGLSEVEGAARFCLARLWVESHWPSYSAPLLASDCLPTREFSKHVGETKCITGKVLRVMAGAKGVHFIGFCEEQAACPFSVVVFASDLNRCSSRKCQFLRFLSSDATQVLSLQSRVQKTRCSADLPS
jgi:hypothetical protein